MQEIDWKKKYENKLKAASAAMKLIKPGNTFLSGPAALNRSIWSIRWSKTPVDFMIRTLSIC
jgi:hypothetical protein